MSAAEPTPAERLVWTRDGWKPADQVETGAAAPTSNGTEEPMAQKVEKKPEQKDPEPKPKRARRHPGRPPRQAEPKATATTGPRGLRQAKLGAGSAVLLVRLEHHAGREATAYRVRWELLDGKKKQQAFAAVRPTEVEARKAFDAHVDRARAEGWFDLVIADGPGRPIELKPLPAPPASR